MILEQENVHQSAIPPEEAFAAAAQADEKGQESHSEPGFFLKSSFIYFNSSLPFPHPKTHVQFCFTYKKTQNLLQLMYWMEFWAREIMGIMKVDPT